MHNVFAIATVHFLAQTFFLQGHDMITGIFSEPDHHRSIDRIKKWPDAKNQRLNPYWPCPRGLPNIEN
jgi:hypothetical protein